MGEISSASRCPGYRSDYDHSLDECCYCHRSLRDPVILKCLHNCCRACAESSATRTHTLKSTFAKCPVCDDATELSAVMSNGLLCNYQRLSNLSSVVVNCNACDFLDVAAVYWCTDCCLGLCESCYSGHNRFTRHHRSAELEVARAWSLSQLTPAVECGTHKRQMEVQCFTCHGPKCMRCYESCRVAKHDLEPLSHGKCKNYVSTLIDAISSNGERLSRAVSRLQQKCQGVRRRLREALKDGSRMLLKHKHSLCDGTVNAFDMSVGQVCTNVERIWYVSTTGMKIRVTVCETAALAGRNLEMLVVARLNWVKLHLESHLLERIVASCTKELRILLRQRRTYWQENGAFCINGSLPLTSDIALRSCLGATDRRQAAPPAPVHFSKVPFTFQTTFSCWDIAVTKEGHVLVSASDNGLIEYNNRGQQLSRWLPARRSDGREDEVCGIAVLYNGQAAVCVYWAQLVVLLRRSSTGDTWLENGCVAVRSAPPRYLAVHYDLMAVSVDRLDNECWVRGRDVQLLRLNSGQLLYTHSRDYEIGRITLTALCLVTVSSRPVKRNSGATPCVVDAFSHSDEFLWRFESSDEELVTGLCSADNWSRLYLAVVMREGSSSARVMVFGGADGKHGGDVMRSSIHKLQLPGLLSLARGEQHTVLAVLSWDKSARHLRTVSMYEATEE